MKSLLVAALLLGTSLGFRPGMTNRRRLVNPDVSGNAWGRLKSDEDYVEQGVIEQVGGDLPVYRIGTGNDKCVIWNPDIYGFDSGITRQLADRLSGDLGVTVIVPDYTRGDYRSPETPGFAEWLGDISNWDNLKRDWEDKLRPYAEEQHGCKVFAAHGTCSGTYLVMKLSARPEFVTGTQAHPSHPIIMEILGEDEEAAYKEIRNKPQLLMPAGGDPDSVKPGGLACRTLGGFMKGHRSFVFDEMKHGWTIRGDVTDPKVAAQMEKAYCFVKFHMSKNLVNNYASRRRYGKSYVSQRYGKSYASRRSFSRNYAWRRG